MTKYRLCKTYRENKIKFKKIFHTKIMSEEKKKEARDHAILAYKELGQSIKGKYELVQLDEFMVTVRTVQDKAWSRNKEHFMIDKKLFKIITTAVIVAISKSKGIEIVSMWNKSVNKEKFSKFLTRFRKENPDRKIHLQMDQLRSHTCNMVTKKMKELGFTYSFLPIYSPLTNGTELVIQ
jgi:hypothetical protein